MARLLKLLIIVLVIAALVGSSAYVYLRQSDNGNDGGDDGTNPPPDTTAPTINSTTGDTTGTAGRTTEITVQFWDNVNVTSAILFYRKAGDTVWSNVSMMPGGSANIVIPMGDTTNYQYYITVDDAAGNGPVGAPSVDGSSFYTITVHQQNVTLVHNVFIEEGTATWCTNCPSIAEALHELEVDTSLHFYYVSLIEDHSTAAHNRLVDDYNYWGLPTVYVDGGYNVLLRAIPPQSKDNITNAITLAENRDTPPLWLTVSAINDNRTNQTNTTITVTNYGSAPYVGTLRVYLAERVSVADASGKSYHHGLLDIIAKESVTVAAGNSLVKSYPITTTGLDIENLEVYAAIFNNTGVSKYNKPDTQNNSFTSYYTDACNHTVLIPGGNLPPSVGITSPTLYSLNFFKLHILKNIHFKNITCIGRPMITVTATDDSAVARVEFYIDGILFKTLTTAPYQYKWPMKKISLLGLKLHNVTVVAYDDTGKKASDSILLHVIGL